MVTEGIPVYGMNGVGAGKDSPASEALIKAADKDDPRPMWVTAWGGPGVLAQSLWKVREDTVGGRIEKVHCQACVSTRSRIRTTAAHGSAKEFPDLFYVASPGFPSRRCLPSTQLGAASVETTFTLVARVRTFSLVTNEWLDTNVRAQRSAGQRISPLGILDGG